MTTELHPSTETTVGQALPEAERRAARRERIAQKIGKSSFALPDLPFARDSLAPTISPMTVSLHYDKHHRSYANQLRDLARHGPLASRSLEEVILFTADDPTQRRLFNNAAQVWNHNFYWKSLTPKQTSPASTLANAIQRQFGSLAHLKDILYRTCVNHFGSGWGWLVARGSRMDVVSTENAHVPFLEGSVPLLAIDLWEHAYYLDYMNRKSDYLTGVMQHLLNWEFASEQFERARLAPSERLH